MEPTIEQVIPPPEVAEVVEPEDISFEELAEIDRAARARLAAQTDERRTERLAASDVQGPGGVLQALDHGAVRHVHRCQGGCSTPVRSRGDWCGPCAAESRKVAVGLALHHAFESISPGGSRGWCRSGDPAFEAAVSGSLEKPGIRELYRRLPAKDRHYVLDNFVLRARWRHDVGSVALIGPTGIGKSVLLTAVALGALEAARLGRVAPGSHDFAAIAGMRYVSGLELAKDERRHKLGDGESPLIRAAKRATILVLDEVGYGDDAGDVSAVREILRARYERGTPRPTLFASGRRVDELNARYGEATMRCLWGRGHVADLYAVAAINGGKPV